MGITTRTGDGGETGLLDGSRVPKDSSRIELVGTIDELDAHLAEIAALPASPETKTELKKIRFDLFSAVQPCACLPRQAAGSACGIAPLVAELEEAAASLKKYQPEGFVLDWKTPAAAKLNLARAVCRRAERRAAASSRADKTEPFIAVFLNRLSDVLFLLACAENKC
jgi:cob(I)alamin adenosyltransferase